MADINVPVNDSRATDEKGIPNSNAGLQRTDEQQLTGESAQGGATDAVNKTTEGTETDPTSEKQIKVKALEMTEEKLRAQFPDWPEEKIKTVSLAAFNRAIKSQSGKASNEGNADERPKQTTLSGGFGN